MNLAEFAHTEKKTIEEVYRLYLVGYSEEEIFILTEVELPMISNIIDCCNYLFQ